MILEKMINLFSKTHDFIKNMNLLSKTFYFMKADKFANKKWKSVISAKKVFPLVCSKYLSSWTGLGRSGHVQSQSFGPISHISGSELGC